MRAVWSVRAMPLVITRNTSRSHARSRKRARPRSTGARRCPPRCSDGLPCPPWHHGARRRLPKARLRPASLEAHRKGSLMTWGIPHVMRTTMSAQRARIPGALRARAIGRLPRAWGRPRADQGQNHCVEADQPLERPVSVERAYEFPQHGMRRGRQKQRTRRPPQAAPRRRNRPPRTWSFSRTKVLLPRMRATYHENHRSMPPPPAWQASRVPAHCRNHPAKSPVTPPKRDRATWRYHASAKSPATAIRGADGLRHRDHPCSRSRSESTKRHDDHRTLLSRREPRGHAVSARAAGQHSTASPESARENTSEHRSARNAPAVSGSAVNRETAE